MIEFDYSHVFHVDENFVKKLIVRHFKIIHQFSWFKKLIFVFITVVIAIVVVITSIVQQFNVVLYKSHNMLQFSSIVQSIVVYKTTTIFFVSSISFECDSHYTVHSQKFFFFFSSFEIVFRKKIFYKSIVCRFYRNNHVQRRYYTSINRYQNFRRYRRKILYVVKKYWIRRVIEEELNAYIFQVKLKRANIR